MAEIRLNYRGFRQVRTHPNTVDLVSGLARDVQRRSGDGFELTVPVPRNRARAQVWPGTIHAKRSNARDNTMVRALGSMS